MESLRTPLRSPDYAPFLQRAKDAKPDALFVFVPSGEGAAFMKQFAERGLERRGIGLIGTGDVIDDDLLDEMGRAALGVVTSLHYSAAHPSPENKEYVQAFKTANKGFRPNFHSVAGYDGMHVIYNAVADDRGPRRRAAARGDEGQGWRARAARSRSTPQTRDTVQHGLHPQGRAEGRPLLEDRLRQGRQRQGPGREG